MGCSSSGPVKPNRVNNARRNAYTVNVFDDEEDKEPIPVILTKEEQNVKDIQSILDGVSSVPIPHNVNPVVSLSSDSFPAIICGFKVDPTQNVCIRLPLMILSNTDKGRYIVIGSAEYLQQKMIAKTEISALIENIGMWTSGFRMKTTKVLLFDFPTHLMNTVTNNLVSFGYSVEQAQKVLPDKLPYDIIVCPSYVSNANSIARLEEFAKTGCLLVFVMQSFDPETKYAMNVLLKKVSIAIPRSNLISGETTSKIVSYETLKTFTADYHFNHFLDLISAEKVNEEEIDSSVATLRFYASNFGENQGELAAQLTDKCWAFLEKIGYFEDGLYCTGVIQSIIAILISDVMPCVPPNLVKVAPPSRVFPGECGNYVLENAQIRMKITANLMHSTGLYLPPGVIGEIKASGPVIVQIGSHEVCLLEKTGGWNRWPVITTTVDVGTDVKTIASPFGGIVYIGEKKKQNISVMFKNFVKYRRYSVKDDSWFDTEKSPIPWSEIEMNHLTVTVPTVIFPHFEGRMHENFSQLEKIIADSLGFIAITRNGNKRVVFDADLNTDVPEVGDIIILRIDELPGAIDTLEFSDSLLMFVSLIVMSMIPEDFLDEDAELALATVAAYRSLRYNLIDGTPLNIEELDPPPLFAMIWDFANTSPSAFTNAMHEFFKINFKKTDEVTDRWKTFVDTLTKYSNKQSGMPRSGSLIKLNDRFKMTELLSCNSSDFLQMYVLEDINSSFNDK